MSPKALQPGPDETLDRLSRTLWILQRRRGHRATTDDVLLAAVGAGVAPDARRILDLGCGKGTVALLLSQVAPAARIIGVEAFGESHALALRNAALNRLSDRFLPLLGDLRDPAVLAGQAPFDLVCGAPPFMPLGSGVLPQDPQRAAGRFELRGSVFDYAATAARHLSPAGRLVLLMDGLGQARLREAVAAAGLSLRSELAVCPRPGRPPTFWIGVAALAPEPAPPPDDAPVLCLRAEAGEAWSFAYAALRERLALP